MMDVHAIWFIIAVILVVFAYIAAMVARWKPRDTEEWLQAMGCTVFMALLWPLVFAGLLLVAVCWLLMYLLQLNSQSATPDPSTHDQLMGKEGGE